MQFDAHLQPWTLASLPLAPPSADPSSPPTTSPRSPEIDQPFLADLAPRSSTVTIPYLGDDLDIGKPNACWAGMMSFFLRTAVWRDVDAEEGEGTDDGDGHVQTLTAGPADPGSPTASVTGPTMPHAPRVSLAFDLEWDRLVSCREPYAPAPQAAAQPDAEAEPVGTSNGGLGIWKVRRTLEGVWGGEFAFLDFDSYRCVPSLSRARLSPKRGSCADIPSTSAPAAQRHAQRP